MACICGIMMYVAYNMVKPAEVSLVLSRGRLESLVMVYTAVMVLVTNFGRVGTEVRRVLSQTPRCECQFARVWWFPCLFEGPEPSPDCGSC